MRYDDFLRGAAYLKETGLTVRPLLRTQGMISPTLAAQLAASEAAVEVNDGEALQALVTAGVRDLFFRCGGQTDAALTAAHGGCRYVLENRAQLEQLDRVVQPLLPEGYLENVAIRLLPTGGDEAFTEENLPQLARWIRRSQALAVRCVFLDLRAAADLSEAAKQGFSLVKKIRSDLPCIFHGFCFEGLLVPLCSGDERLRKTLEMLASLNDTSLYATFYLA